MRGVLLGILLLVLVTKAEVVIYSNHFIAKLRNPRAAHGGLEIANDHKLRLFPTVVAEGEAVHLVDPRLPHTTTRLAVRQVRALNSDPRVVWAQQQVLRYRELRKPPTGLSEECKPPSENRLQERSDNEMENTTWRFNDPFYPMQWYLHGKSPEGEVNAVKSLRVDKLWDLGLTGRGVTLFVLDDGLQDTNPEIKDNFEARGGGDVSDLKKKLPSTLSLSSVPLMPEPRSWEDAHGTYCAAVMAAVGDNGVCGVGVAPQAKVGGVKLLGNGPVSDLQEALSLSLWLPFADIASASWGPKDNGKSLDGPGPLARKAFRDAIKKGREGRGAILVWAAGNGGFREDSCACDGYTSSPFTLTVGALTHHGGSCFYSEPCAAVLAGIHVTGPQTPCGIASVVVPELDSSCRSSFQGTSAAAPLAAGIIALALEANPNLTWREVQHLVATTSRPMGQALQDPEWRMNGAGLKFHPRQGFGAMQPSALVKAAKRLQRNPLPPQKSAVYVYPIIEKLRSGGNTTLVLHVPDQPDSVSTLEHVMTSLTVLHPRRGGLEIFLISPEGTESQLLTLRQRDNSDEGFRAWPFLSVHFWGERPAGLWRLVLANHEDQPGELTRFVLQLKGHNGERKEFLPSTQGLHRFFQSLSRKS